MADRVDAAASDPSGDEVCLTAGDAVRGAGSGELAAQDRPSAVRGDVDRLTGQELGAGAQGHVLPVTRGHQVKVRAFARACSMTSAIAIDSEARSLKDSAVS